MELFKHRRDFGLHAVHVKVLGIRMAGLTALHFGQVGVITLISHVAVHAGVLNRLIVRARTAAHTQSTFAQQHRGWYAIVGAEPAGCNLNVSSSDSGRCVADLMAIGAQIAFAAVEGTAGHFHQHRLFTSRQGEVGPGVGGVDVMAGAAVERRHVHHAYYRRVMRGQAGVNARLGALSTVTAGAGGTFPSYEGLARPVHRTLSELRFLRPNQGCVIVAFGAGQLGRCQCRTGFTLWTSRALRSGRALRPRWPGLTGCAGARGQDQSQPEAKQPQTGESNGVSFHCHPPCGQSPWIRRSKSSGCSIVRLSCRYTIDLLSARLRLMMRTGQEIASRTSFTSAGT